MAGELGRSCRRNAGRGAARLREGEPGGLAGGPGSWAGRLDPAADLPRPRRVPGYDGLGVRVRRVRGLVPPVRASAESAGRGLTMTDVAIVGASGYAAREL